MTQMLWEKVVRWYMLGHADFLVMTVFAVSYLGLWPKYLNIHLVLCPISFTSADRTFEGTELSEF